MIDLSKAKTLADILRAQADARPTDPAFVKDGAVTSFAEFDARASRIAQRLLAAGLTPGERVAILSKNTDAFYEIMFGAAKARATLAPVNFRLAAPEIAYILKDSGARILFVGADFHDLAEKALADLAEKPALIALDGPREGYTLYRPWRDDLATRDPMLKAEADDDVLQLYTSGTTGLPKGVQLTNANYHAFLSLARAVEGFNYQPGERVLNAMPQFHVAGANIGVIATSTGSTTIILKDLAPAAALGLIEQHKIAHAFFVPAVILMLLQAPEMATANLTSLKTIAYGASPIAEELLLKAQERFGCRFLQLYGMTETVGAATFLPPEAHDPARGKLRSCGLAWPGIDVEIVDADGKPLPPGQVGEIVIRAPVVMKGYWNKPDATADTIRNGWLHTGDAAYKDEEGFFFIYDRVKDMIVTGGENVYPAEVENAIFGHPAVADVAVIGVPDDKWGEAVKAVVVAKPGATIDPAAIIAHAKERIAGYKVPKSIDVVDAIPRNPSGKILRRELRKPYWEGRSRQVG
ncbi:MAG: long-chain-fatty-acid--CoA ligase [Alphaproteobacteria bacterium]|nr:long-chain-fatty-acid--CoA ligase [Alphaproteobacteria bacterium]